MSPSRATASVVVALTVHFGLALTGATPNPGVAALAGMALAIPIALGRPSRAPARRPLPLPGA